MKSILIAATTVGAAIAGLILYYRRRSDSSAGKLSYPGTGSSKLGNVKGERDLIHAMG